MSDTVWLKTVYILAVYRISYINFNIYINISTETSKQRKQTDSDSSRSF